MLLFVGILLSIATGLLGLFCLLCGVVVGILGVGPFGTVSNAGTRFIFGVLPLLLGVIYLTPVMTFRRRSWVIVYGGITFLAAVIVVAVALSVALVSRNALPALFFLSAPATALVAYIRVCRTQGRHETLVQATPGRASRSRT
jgi:hypothetical protein